jgi:hypothetical protein
MCPIYATHNKHVYGRFEELHLARVTKIKLHSFCVPRCFFAKLVGDPQHLKIRSKQKIWILVIPSNFVKFGKIQPNFDWRFYTVKNQKSVELTD